MKSLVDHAPPEHLAAAAVKAWSEPVAIPTYEVGRPQHHPMFLDKRVYQGSSGSVYPYAVIEEVADEPVQRVWQVVFLENEYLKVAILPELGGRVHMAFDKTNEYHFVYHNRVIKPALVGLTGPWISGGIEFNWPQHHRPSTYSPVDVRLEESPCGSWTVWCSEIERMYRTKGMVGFRLRPDRAVLELDVRLYNRTPHVQTFLWWANPAVAVDENHQSIFPPDVHAVMDHGKRDVSSFPIATGTYYKVDYSPGTDISRFRNIPVPTSYMAHHSDYDFVGSYDHGRSAGLVHVADHHISPGKKQWTWGNGDFGKAWERQLTDEDGPYIELMCGVYTDNQPDFAWQQPYEQKSFVQNFLPYKGVGRITNATADAVVRLEVVDARTVEVALYVTSPRPDTVLRLEAEGRTLLEERHDLTPWEALTTRMHLRDDVRPDALQLVVEHGGTVLVSDRPYTSVPAEPPPPATPVPRDHDTRTNEEVYLDGLHLEQYRHATYPPETYYAEVLRRDGDDSSANLALGRRQLVRGLFAEAKASFQRAIDRRTMHNPNPSDGEAHYQLGVAAMLLDDVEAAETALAKAGWNAAWRDASSFLRARLASRRGEYEPAIQHCEQALTRNNELHQARHLKAAMLRRLGRADAAAEVVVEALRRDPLDLGALNERTLLAPRLDGGGPWKPQQVADEQREVYRDAAHNYAEIALDYAHAGLHDDATDLLAGFCERAEPTEVDPTVAYILAWICDRAGHPDEAAERRRWASRLPQVGWFPHQIEAVPALQAATEADPCDATAHRLLGTFWYSRGEAERAIDRWERARGLAETDAAVHRNLGLAYFNHRHDHPAARASFVRAFELDDRDARVLFELDQLDHRLGANPQQRLQRLTDHRHLVEQRDDLYISWVTLLNVAGQHAEAHAALLRRRFHPWEGGEGKVTDQYVTALTSLAAADLADGKPGDAVRRLRAAQEYPDNLGEGKLAGATENETWFLLGQAFDLLEERDESRRAFTMAALGDTEPAPNWYYNDQPPYLIYYRARALERLGRRGEAVEIFQQLVDHAVAHREDDPSIDYFAVSLPDFLVFDEDLRRRNRLYCDEIEALGWLGLRRLDEAIAAFQRVLEVDPSHIVALRHLPIASARQHDGGGPV